MSPTLRILLVEDHIDTLHWLTVYLESSGDVVVKTRSVAEAMSFLNSSYCQVLISDISLPDGSGWELMKQISPHKRPFAIAISGLGSRADVEKSLQSGFRYHLKKPFRMAELGKILKEAAAELSPSNAGHS